MLKKYFDQVFKYTKMTEEINELKTNHYNMALDKVNTFVIEGNSKNKAEKMVIESLGCIETYRNLLNLPLNNFKIFDWFFYVTVLIQKLFLIFIFIYLLIPNNKFLSLMTNIYRYIKLENTSIILIFSLSFTIINFVLLIIMTSQITKTIAIRCILIIFGIITLPMGILNILIGLLQTRNRNYKNISNYLLNEMRTNKEKKYQIITIIVLIFIYISYGIIFFLLRVPTVSGYYISFSKNFNEQYGYIYGELYLKEYDNKSILITPNINIVLPETFPEDTVIKMNYFVNDNPGFETNGHYYKGVYLDEKESFIISQNIGNILKELKIVFEFYYEYEDENYIVTYEIKEDEDFIKIREHNEYKTKWIWE